MLNMCEYITLTCYLGNIQYIYITQLETTRCISENNISFLKLPQIEYHMFKNKR